MADGRRGAHFLRERAERLRQIASTPTKISPELMRMARELDEKADQLEDIATRDVIMGQKH